MPLPRRVKIRGNNNNIASAASGSTFTWVLDLNLRYHQIDVVFYDGANAQTLTAVLGDVVLYRNDKPRRTHSALELDHLNNLNGSQYSVASQTNGTAGTDREQTLPIYLSEPWRKDIAQTDSQAWDADVTHGFQSFQLKITTIAALSATSNIEIWAYVTDVNPLPKNGSMPFLKKVYRGQITASGVSNEIATELPKFAGFFQNISLKQPSGAGVIQYVTVRQNGNSGVPIIDRATAYMLWNFATSRGMNPGMSLAASGFGADLVFDILDPIQWAIAPGANGLYVKVEYTPAATGAGNLVFLAEVIGTLDQD